MFDRRKPCTARLTRPGRATHGNLSSEIIKWSPEYTPESLNRECEIELQRHYDRQGYWADEPAAKEPKEDSMKVRINKQCMGDRNCHKLCPEVFEYDEDQLLAIVKFDVIPEQYHELVRRAARECVPQAIEIEE
jgi:ferredoxin